MATKRTQAEFEQEAKEFESRGIQLVEGQTYATVHTLYRWRCAHDGHEWQAPFVRIAQGSGCPVCGAKRTGVKKSLGLEEFTKRMEERNQIYSPITYLSGFTNSTSKCTFKCDVCDHQWETVPKSLFRGVGCPKCGLTKRSADRVKVVHPPKLTTPRRDDATFQAECAIMAKERGIILVEGQTYQGTHHYYTWKCTHDGHEWQAPHSRIFQGKGCPVCGAKRAGFNTAIDFDVFMERIKERNQRYSPTVTYVSGYTGTASKCLFKCDSCGHEWQTTAKGLCTGHGCPECGKKKASNSHTYTLNDVLALLVKRNEELPHKRVHMVETSFTGYRNKATFTCDHGHTWETKLDNVINAKAGCPHCAGSIQRATEDAISEIKHKHPLITIISPLGDTLGRRENFEAVCEHGHRWTTTYERLLINRNYCPHCANRAKYTQAQFEQRMAANNPGLTVIGEYTGMNNRVDIKCNACGHQWNPTAQRVHEGGGCPMCAINNKFSKKAINWLVSIEQQQSITIQHAKQTGEFRIPGTRFRVDGYHRDSNTVYEFYGDYWHGNPKKHDPDGVNIHLQITYGELYESTLAREQQIRDLGYNVVSIWEMDYDQITTQS